MHKASRDWALFAAAAFAAGCGEVKRVSETSHDAALVGSDGAPLAPDATSTGVADSGFEIAFLDLYQDCPTASFLDQAPLFAPTVEGEDFDEAFADRWSVHHVVPRVTPAGTLAFGPHPMSADWWENYSSVVSVSDVEGSLLCARIRLTPQEGADEDANSFSITLHLPNEPAYETSGMAFAIKVELSTRTGPTNWIRYDEAAFAVEVGSERTLDLFL